MQAHDIARHQARRRFLGRRRPKIPAAIPPAAAHASNFPPCPPHAISRQLNIPMHSSNAVNNPATSAADMSDPHGVRRVTLNAPANAANAVRPKRIGNAPSSPTPPAVITPASSPAPQAQISKDTDTPRAMISHKAPDFRRTVVF